MRNPATSRGRPQPFRRKRRLGAPKEKLIVLYCWDGWRSLAATAALALLQNGYRVKELHGGVAAWQSLDLPQQSERLSPERRASGAWPIFDGNYRVPAVLPTAAAITPSTAPSSTIMGSAVFAASKCPEIVNMATPWASAQICSAT